MLIRDVISDSVKPLRATDTAREALDAMREGGHVVMPVVDQTTQRFIGMLKRRAVEHHNTEIDSVLHLRERDTVVADPEQNVFETTRLMVKHKLDLIAVVDKDQGYLGVVERIFLFDQIVQSMNFTEHGSLITIHFEERDFTLSQVVRIIEAEGGLIIGLSVESPRGNHPFYVISIKLNLTDPTRIMAALRRHEYIVDAQSTDREDDKRYEQRADELIHFLNM